MDKSLFGTSGIRGDAKTLFTDQFCFDIGRTFIEFLKRKNELGPIAVGMDPRDSSPRIKNDLFLGLVYEKTPLYDEGITPIPSMNWLLKTTDVKGAVMISGSHIAPELNGVKFYAHEEEVSEEDQKEIEKIYYEIKEKKKAINKKISVIEEDRAKKLYLEMLLGLAKKPYPSWKVAIDCANGAQSVVMPEVLENLGLGVTRVNCSTSGGFIARDTDTDDQAQIEELKDTVQRENCDFGVAYDGDGDRVVFVDEKGNFVQGEYSCSLVAKESPGESIITPISSSQVVETLGKKVYRTKVGSPFVVGKMKDVKALFGFEPNGGAISGEIMYTRDGGSMTLKVLNLFSRFKGKFSEMIATLPKFYMFRTKVEYKWELKDRIISEAKTKFKGVKVEELDGLKIWLDETSWVLFRSSANAPEFRVFAESKDEAKAKNLLQEGMQFVQKVVRENA